MKKKLVQTIPFQKKFQVEYILLTMQKTLIKAKSFFVLG